MLFRPSGFLNGPRANMVRNQRKAIRALNDVIVLARMMAYERRDHQQIAKLLDDADYLPYLILCDQDMTETFRGCLASIASDFQWKMLVDHFDEPESPRQ